MKNISYFLLAIMVFMMANACKTTQETKETIVIQDQMGNSSDQQMEITLLKGKSFNHPSFVIWIEDTDGNYIKTIFITKSYASGIFGYKMIGDSLWVKEAGFSLQPAALPYWTHKKGLLKNGQLMPTPENPFVDAYTGATPQQDFVFVSQPYQTESKYRILLEVNQAWDWNDFWTNDKYLDNPAYLHSAQPSLVYSVDINPEESDFYLNPIGHGDAKGESGKLFTDISSLSSAKEIFRTLKIEISNQ